MSELVRKATKKVETDKNSREFLVISGGTCDGLVFKLDNPEGNHPAGARYYSGDQQLNFNETKKHWHIRGYAQGKLWINGGNEVTFITEQGIETPRFSGSFHPTLEKALAALQKQK